MQQRRDEILAKKAKLAELKRQRELRKQESASRQSLSGSPLGEVRQHLNRCQMATNGRPRYYRQHHGEAKTSIEGPTSPTSSTASLEKAGRALRNLAHRQAQDGQHGPHR